MSITRGDLNGAKLNLSYDGSNRLTVAERQPDSGHGSFTAGLPDRWSYTYDEAQNLLSRSEDTACSDATEIAMPLDPSGRNRPSAVGGVSLAWDASGNLKTKGDLTFHYDYRDRLIRVEHATNGTLAEYNYDAFNRRIEKLTGGQVESTVWSGWQDIETYVDGALAERKSYGTGLDELVRFETFPSGTSYLPVYDHTGNLALLTDASGKPVERYEYSPFGERWTFVDSLAPVVEQVRIQDGAVWLEISKEVDFAEIQTAASDGRLTLSNDTAGQPIAFSVSQPVRDGRQAGRRLALTPLQAPPAGDTVSLQLAAGVLRDFFDNENANPFAPPPFLWPSTDVVVQDTAAPRLAQVCVKSGLLEVQFTEEPDLGHVTNSLLIDGQPSTWTLAADRYTVTSPVLSDGPHQLTIAAGTPLDLVSQSLVDSLTESFTIGVGQPTAQVVWSAPIDGRMESGSAAGNRVGFHGRSRDPETGLLYFRNRYYDPDLGRFVTTDPLGYVDGANLYHYAVNNPMNFYDPMGLESIRGLLNTENDLVDNPVSGIAKWYAYQFWDIATFGFVSEHDQVYEETRGGEYVTKTALAAGKAGTKLYVTFQTGRAGAAFGEAAGLGLLTTSALTGSSVGVTLTATDDLFNFLEGKSTHSIGDYGKAAAMGGVLGTLGGGMARARLARNSGNLVPLKNNSVRTLLTRRGLTRQQAQEVVDSFDGQIYARTGKTGDLFMLTESSRGAASRVFLTRGSAGSSPAFRIQRLALPPSNTARFEGLVRLTRPQLLLEGRVAAQPSFGPGRIGGGWQVVSSGGRYTGAVDLYNPSGPWALPLTSWFSAYNHQ